MKELPAGFTDLGPDRSETQKGTAGTPLSIPAGDRRGVRLLEKGARRQNIFKEEKGRTGREFLMSIPGRIPRLGSKRAAAHPWERSSDYQESAEMQWGRVLQR